MFTKILWSSPVQYIHTVLFSLLIKSQTGNIYRTSKLRILGRERKVQGVDSQTKQMSQTKWDTGKI